MTFLNNKSSMTFEKRRFWKFTVAIVFMGTRFMNSKNRKFSNRHKLLISLSDKMSLKSSNKYVALSNLAIYYTWKNVKKSCKRNRFKVSAAKWNQKFELFNGSYSKV